MMRSALMIVFTFTVFLGLASAQSTATNIFVDRCRTGSDLNTKIEFCTRAINAGDLSTAAVALAFFDRGNAYLAKEEYERAIQDYDQVTRIHVYYSDNILKPYLLTQRAYAYMGVGDYSRAIQDLDQLIQIKSKDAGVLTKRGYAYMNQGDYDRAIQDFDEVIRIKPNDASAFFNRGLARFNATQFTASILDFDKAKERQQQKKDEAYSLIWLYLAQAHAGQGPKEIFVGVQLNLQSWPDPVMSLYRGVISPKEMLDAATDADPKKQRDQQCEGHFYLGEYDVLHGLQGEATAEFRAANDTCQPMFVEGTAAKAQLKRLVQ